MSKQMTPCERLGYKVGDEFEVISHHAFKNGQVVTLHEDDGTECPLFAGDGGGAGVFDGVECSFATLNEQVRKIANKPKPAKQALADAIHQSGGWVEGGDWHKSGELPPVGEVCIFDPNGRTEFFDEKAIGAIGKEVSIISHVKFKGAVGSVAVFMCDSDGVAIVRTASETCFRPLRTEREKAIDEMVCEFIDHHGDPKGGERYLGIAAKLYDAWYRKEAK
ncbi:hypothetical protein phiA005_0041 [Aeromonas phage phiA005]|nr:hypothetical protein phiA005_0041 [Aeromonas phage phiA005]